MTFLLQSELGHTNVATEQPGQNSCALSLMLDMPNNLLNKNLKCLLYRNICRFLLLIFHAAYFRPCRIVTLVQGTERHVKLPADELHSTSLIKE